MLAGRTKTGSHAALVRPLAVSFRLLDYPATCIFHRYAVRPCASFSSSSIRFSEKRSFSSDVSTPNVRSQPKEHSTRLTHDVLHEQPTLAALDELRPPPRKSNYNRLRRSQDTRDISHEQPFSGLDPYAIHEWDTTFRRVSNSFTVKQLSKFVKEAGIPRNVISQYGFAEKNKKRAKFLDHSGSSVDTSKSTGTKSRLVRILLNHYFLMTDPAESANKARNSEKQFHDFVPAPLPSLFLLSVASLIPSDHIIQDTSKFVGNKKRKSSTVRSKPLARLAQECNVKVHGACENKDEQLSFGLQLTGKEEDVSRAREWIHSFTTKVKKTTLPLSSLVPSVFISKRRETGRELYMPSPLHLRRISQYSTAFVEVAEETMNSDAQQEAQELVVHIHTLHDADAQVAVHMLKEQQIEAYEAEHRDLFVYSPGALPSPDVSEKSETTSTMFGSQSVSAENRKDSNNPSLDYAFLPHSGSTSIPWLFRPTEHHGIFRLHCDSSQGIASLDSHQLSHEAYEDHPARLSWSLQKVLPLPQGIPNFKPGLKGPWDLLESPNRFTSIPNVLASESNMAFPSAQLRYVTSFGHLLFQNSQPASSDDNDVTASASSDFPSRMISLLRPPLFGHWPLSHALGWLSASPQLSNEASSSDLWSNQANRKPHFVPAYPPTAIHLFNQSNGGTAAQSLLGASHEVSNWASNLGSALFQNRQRIIRLKYRAPNHEEALIIEIEPSTVPKHTPTTRTTEDEPSPQPEEKASDYPQTTTPNKSSIKVSSNDDSNMFGDQNHDGHYDAHKGNQHENITNFYDHESVHTGEQINAPAFPNNQAMDSTHESHSGAVPSPAEDKLQNAFDDTVNGPDRVPFMIREALWLNKKDADVLVPDSVVDMRLSSECILPADMDALERCNALNEYFKQLVDANGIDTPLTVVAPPNELDLCAANASSQSTMILHLESVQQVTRRTWNLPHESNRPNPNTNVSPNETLDWGAILVEESTLQEGDEAERLSFRVEWNRSVLAQDVLEPDNTGTFVGPSWHIVSNPLTTLLSGSYPTLKGRKTMHL